MKSFILKLQHLSVLLIAFAFMSAQNNLKIPADAVFYMEINGKQLNKKVSWDQFNPILQEITKDKKDKKPSWNDFSKTGIKYDGTQYHYARMNDSVTAYNAYFMLDSKEKFMEFINSSKKKGLEVSKKKNYEYVDIGDDLFVAWNGTHAVLSLINYHKPYDVMTDDVMVYEDSTAVAVDSAYTVDELPFDYKAEIKYLEEEIDYLKEDIKQHNEEILTHQKNIKYLEKNHKYPPEEDTAEATPDANGQLIPPPPPAVDYEESEEEIAYRKEQDSIKIETFRIAKKLAEEDFDRYFNSSLEIEVPKEMLKFRDADSDVYVSANYGKIINRPSLYGMNNAFGYTKFLSNLYNTDSAYNLYFDKDQVRLVNNYQHRNPEIQQNISAVYDGKKNKKLTALINDKSIGYYVLNLNGAKYFDLIYSFMKNSGDHGYQKEVELIVETIKIVLDEEAISKIAPGNGIFVLNELKSKTVDYTDFEYDDDYNEKEIKKTKEVMMPDFVFAFATENEGYWKRFFDMLTTNKEMSANFFKKGEYYTFKDEKDNSYLNEFFFTVKDGTVYFTTSVENLAAKNQTQISKAWIKDSGKYPLSGRLDIQKLLVGLDAEFKGASERKTLNALKRNAGNMYFKTERKGESIQTEIDYQIKNASENSLMYFFDLFDEIYKIMEDKDLPPTL